MASKSEVKRYLAYWLQLGKKVLVGNRGVALSPKQVVRGDRYSREFEECWQQVLSADSGDCYLEGTSEPIGELLTPGWEIVNCGRCPMPKPLRTSGMPPLSCPCGDLPSWPNMDIPLPRSPVSSQSELGAIRDRLSQMADRAYLYASSIVDEIGESKQAEKALERLRRQNELILNSAGEGIWGLDTEMRTTFVNPAAARMLGYEVQELIGQPMHAVLAKYEVGSTKSENLIHKSMENFNGHASTGDGHGRPDITLQTSPVHATLKDGSVQYVSDAVFWRQDGTSFPVEYVSAPIREKGEMVGVVITFKDITERQEVERMKDEFISIVSHELRTPLTAIRGALGLLVSGLLDAQPEKATRMLEMALTNTERLLRLVNDILDLERIHSGKLTLVKQTCNVADLMVQAADSMRAIAEKAGITISVCPISVEVWADPERIIQVLTNLLSNAIKFSPGGTTVWLTGEISPLSKVRSPESLTQNSDGMNRVWTTQHSLLISVKDQGRGIPADQIETIFGRFEQVDTSDSRAYGGTGLGLAICRNIVLLHGGRIWAESQLGEGSTFCFTLPLQPEEEKG